MSTSQAPTVAAAQNAQNAQSNSSKTTAGVDKVNQGMGDVLSDLQTQLQFPGTFSYSVKAQASVSLTGSWEILPGFILQGVQLEASIQKSGDRPVLLGFKLASYINIGGINIIVSGAIPKLQEDQDVDFVLSLKCASLLDAIPTSALLQELKQAAQFDIVSVGNNLLQNTEPTSDAEFAVSATLKITYSHSDKKYLLKGFEIALEKNANWEIIPSKLSLKKANISLIFASATSGTFEAYIAASGKFQLGESTMFTASARLNIESDNVLLALSCDINTSPLVNSAQVMDILAGDKISDDCNKSLVLPPELSHYKNMPIQSQTLVILQKASAGWQLDYARTSLEWDLNWNPISIITLTNIKLVVMAARNGVKFLLKDEALNQLGKLDRQIQFQKSLASDPSKLSFQGVISGTLVIAQTELIAFASYDSQQAVTNVGCYLKDGEILPLTTLISRTILGGSTEMGEQTAVATPELQDFSTQLVATNAPSSCPVNMQWTRKPGVGKDRQFAFSIKDSKLKSLAFSVKFASEKYEWKLTNNMKLVNLGTSFTYEPSSQQGQTGSMRGLVYGQLNTSNNIEVYGIVAGSKTPTASDFLLYLSITVGAKPALGIAPETLLSDPSLQEIKPDMTGWQLDTILPNQQNASTILKSVSASVSLRLSQIKVTDAKNKATYTTKLLFATMSLAIVGDWTVVPDLVIEELSMQARIIPQDTTILTPSSTYVRVKGILNTSISGQAYRLALIALFQSRGAISSFSVRLAGDANVSDDLAHEEQQTLPVSPSGLMTLPALGGKAIEAGELSDDTVDKEFPIRPTQVLSSLSASCTMDVVKAQPSGPWSISQIQFSVTSEQPWAAIQGKLSFTRCKLIVSVKSPRSSTREILVSATTIVAIGASVSLEAVITFLKKSGEKSFILDVTAKKADVLNAVQELTGQTLNTLVPSGTPEFVDGQALGLSIVFGTTTDVGQQSSGYQIQKMSIRYRADASLVLQPFTIQSLVLELNWQTIDQKRSVATTIKGIVQCSNVPVMIALSYSQSDPNIVKFTMEPQKDQPLTISDLASATNTSAPSAYPLPPDVKPFTLFNLSNISGTIGIKATSTTNAGLLVLDADIVSDQKISILDVDQSIKVELLNVGLHWHYDIDKKSTGSVYAYLRCRSGDVQQGSDYTRTDIRVEYTKDNNDDIYKGKFTIANTDTPIEYKDVLNRFLPTTTYNIPSSVNLPSTIPLLEFDAKLVKGKSIELQGIGQIPWSPPALGETRIQIDRVGLSLKVWKSTPTDTTVNFEAGITGSLKLNNFRSIDTARAYLSISTASNAVLIARLEKTSPPTSTSETSTASADIESLSSSTTSTSWRDVAPSSLSAANLSGTGVILLVDWTSSKYLLAGQAENSTYRLAYFSKPRSNQPPKTRGYCLSLSSSTDLAKIWPETQNNIVPDFNISRCAVEVVALGGTVGDFTADLTDINRLMAGKTDFADTQVSLTSTNEIMSGAPPSTALADGSWLFAEVQFGGDRELSSTLGMLVPSNSTTKLLLYAQIGKGDTIYAMKLLGPLSLFGGSIIISDATGAYKPAFTKSISGTPIFQPATITLAANVKIDKVTSTPLLLSTTMTTLKGNVSFEAVITTTTSVRSPFSGMFNVELVSIGFSGDISKNTSGVVERFYAISGGVRLGGGSSSSPVGGETGVKGAILFKDGAAVAAVVDFIDPVPISKIFSQIIQPGDPSAGQWPGDFNAITFYNVSMSYVPDVQPVEAPSKTANGTKVYKTYKSGFSVSGDLEIGFAKRLQTSATISRSGIVISGSYDQILDLDFMKLSGITLAIDTTAGKKAYSISSGVEFFGVKDITIELKFIPADSTQTNRFEGTIQRKGTVSDIVGNQLKIIYQDGSFSIAGWEFTKTIDDLQGLAKDIENLSKDRGACGKIVNYVWDQAVKGRFDYKFSLPKNQKKEKDGKVLFTFQVDWTYTISVLGKQIITHQFLKVPVDIVGPFTLQEFDQFLVNFITQNVPNIASALLDDPIALGELYGLMAVERFGAEAIASLICRGSKNPRIIDRSNELVNKGEKDINENYDKVKNTELETPSGGGGSSGFGSILSVFGEALSAVETAEGIAGGIIFGIGAGALISLLSTLFSSQKSQLEQRRADAVKRAADARAALLLLQQKLQAYLALSGNPTVVFGPPDPANGNSSTITIDWSSVLPKNKNGGTFTDYNGITWEVIASPNNNSSDDSALKRSTTDRRVTLTTSNEKFKVAPSVWVSVRGSVTVRTTTITGSWNVSETPRPTPQPQPVSVTNLIQNGDFGRNDFNGWDFNLSGGTVRIEQPGLFGSPYKAVAAVRSGNPYSFVGFIQNLDTVPGKQYKLSLSGRFRDRNSDCYCNVFINGAYVISKRSGSTDPFNESNPFTAGVGKSKLEINLTNTWYASMTYEIGNIKAELIS